MSKVSGELWCQYYHDKFGVDVRSIRYPGLIGFRSEPGGGTTDYAVEAFQAALEDRTLQCYLAPDERLPMMTMEDAVRGTLELMEAPAHNIRVRTSYNLQGCSFTPDELARTIQQTVPGFHMHCIQLPGKTLQRRGPTAWTTRKPRRIGVGAQNTMSRGWWPTFWKAFLHLSMVEKV